MYKIDFGLITIAGNLTRVMITEEALKPQRAGFATRIFPIRTWVPGDWLGFLPGHVRLRLRHLLDARRLLLGHRADAVVLHAFETYTQYMAATLLFRRKRMVVVSNPDWLPGGFIAGRKLPWLRRKMLLRTDLFVQWTPLIADAVRKTYPELPADRVRALHPGIDLAKWSYTPRCAHDGSTRLLFVGADVERKGLSILLEMFEQELISDCTLDIATTSYNVQPLRARIAAIPQATLHLDLEPGSAELRRLFESADLFVLPTAHEGAPWVVIEAMAAGATVITTAVGGIPDIVDDGHTGRLVERSPSAFAAAIGMLQASPQTRLRWSWGARQSVESKYDVHKNTAQMLEWIAELVDMKRAVHGRRRRATLV